MCTLFHFVPKVEKGVKLVVVLIVILSRQCGETSVVPKDSQAAPGGLYTADDKVVVLSKSNFNSKLFNKNHAWIIEFYNSWCGFCRKFAPDWKEFASDVANWKDIVSVAAIDCANDENNDICRNYEIMVYPTLKFFHENYIEGADKFGQTIQKGSNPKELREILVSWLHKEQINGRGKNWPLLLPQNHSDFREVFQRHPSNVKFAFLIFNEHNSTIASEVILDMNLVYGVTIQEISNSSQLIKTLNVHDFPSVFVLDKSYRTTPLRIGDKTRLSIRKTIVDFLNSEKIVIPNALSNEKDTEIDHPSKTSLFGTKIFDIGDVVYQIDLETGLRYTLNNEISRLKYIRGEAYEALKLYLHVLTKYFPFTANGKDFMVQLKRRILQSKETTGKAFADYIDDLENKYAPVYSTLPEWYGCKGSAPNYRGYTCSLWTIFHVLTVSAAAQKTTDASEVLRAMHAYVKNFFGCTDCAEHFQAMAKKNNLFSVAENDGAIIWLWVAHNEVNHRLAGDITEDPEHPKRQYPVIQNCPKCWQDKGAWNMTEVLAYLKRVYGVSQISLSGVVPHPSSSPLSKFDITIFVLLHIYFAVMLLLVLRMILIKKIYKRKSFKADALRKV